MYRNLNSKILLIASIVTAILFASFIFISLDNDAPLMVFNLVAGALFFGWMLLIYNTSTVRNTYYWNLITVSFSVLIVGALFKIQHWEGASLIMMAGMGGIIITYAIRFIKKKSKTRLDVLKLLLVVSYFGYYYSRVQHWVPQTYGIVYLVVFLILIIDFSRQFDRLKMQSVSRHVR